MNLLYKIKKYIEMMSVNEDGEWGSGRELEQIIADGDMPDIYNDVLQAIKEMETLKAAPAVGVHHTTLLNGGGILR